MREALSRRRLGCAVHRGLELRAGRRLELERVGVGGVAADPGAVGACGGRDGSNVLVRGAQQPGCAWWQPWRQRAAALWHKLERLREQNSRQSPPSQILALRGCMSQSAVCCAAAAAAW